MDLPELKRLAQVSIDAAPRDLALARAKFARHAMRDPQALFVMCDDEAKRAIAEAWFSAFVQKSRSPQGEGAAKLTPPATANYRVPHPNNSSPATSVPPRLEGHHYGAGDETPSERAATIPRPVLADGKAPSRSEIRPTGPGQLRTAHPGQPKAASPVGHRIAAARVAHHVTRTLFDSFKIRDGRAIGDVRWFELERLRGANAREAAVLRQIQRIGVPPTPDALVRDVVKLAELERFIQRGAEEADAA